MITSRKSNYNLGMENVPVPPSLSQVRNAVTDTFFLPSLSTNNLMVRSNLVPPTGFQLDALCTFTPSILNLVCIGATLQVRWMRVSSTLSTMTSPGRQFFLLPSTLKLKSHALAEMNTEHINISADKNLFRITFKFLIINII